MTRLSLAQARELGILPKREKRPKLRTAVQWDARVILGGVWIQIPEIPPSLNVWKNWHWSKQNQYKQDLYDAIGKLKLAFHLPQIKYARIDITYYFPTKRGRDLTDNFAPKFLNDALVKGGLLVDDRTEYIGLPNLRAEIDRERPRVEITIWRE